MFWMIVCHFMYVYLQVMMKDAMHLFIYLLLHATIPRSSYKIREAFVHIEC
jgi:hypothetical protein